MLTQAQQQQQNERREAFHAATFRMSKAEILFRVKDLIAERFTAVDDEYPLTQLSNGIGQHAHELGRRAMEKQHET